MEITDEEAAAIQYGSSLDIPLQPAAQNMTEEDKEYSEMK